MRRSYGKAPAALLTAAVLGLSSVAGMATPAMAQSTSSQQEAPHYAPAKLKAFAKTALQVQQINKAAKEKFQGASSKDEQETIQKEAYADLKSAITSQGMTLEEYNEIASAAQSNKDLRQRITNYMMKMQDSGGQ
ncbi:hypothetical protein FHS78_003042 [Parvibaculum indicum]|uniref:DUF4168 domain-containing protein n=1 Tax=Parvibaculum indicum TaxID=562969 RepID=UPI00142075B5|nr:DUF4168 domain-containing protein [Parvibaculum indicum]NIJ42737.1 hypothetical protein [Parvibaculum indicum]